jgi:hypothetical protein
VPGGKLTGGGTVSIGGDGGGSLGGTGTGVSSTGGAGVPGGRAGGVPGGPGGGVTGGVEGGVAGGVGGGVAGGVTVGGGVGPPQSNACAELIDNITATTVPAAAHSQRTFEVVLPPMVQPPFSIRIVHSAPAEAPTRRDNGKSPCRGQARLVEFSGLGEAIWEKSRGCRSHKSSQLASFLVKGFRPSCLASELDAGLRFSRY